MEYCRLRPLWTGMPHGWMQAGKTQTHQAYLILSRRNMPPPASLAKCIQACVPLYLLCVY